MKKDILAQDAVISVQVPKEVRNTFMDKVKSCGTKGSLLLKDFIYDYIENHNPNKEVLQRKNRQISVPVNDTYLEFRDICLQKKEPMQEVMDRLVSRYIADKR